MCLALADGLRSNSADLGTELPRRGTPIGRSRRPVAGNSLDGSRRRTPWGYRSEEPLRATAVHDRVGYGVGMPLIPVSRRSHGAIQGDARSLLDHVRRLVGCGVEGRTTLGESYPLTRSERGSAEVTRRGAGRRILVRPYASDVVFTERGLDRVEMWERLAWATEASPRRRRRIIPRTGSRAASLSLDRHPPERVLEVVTRRQGVLVVAATSVRRTIVGTPGCQYLRIE
jgi:hypothetical protein